MSSSDVLLAGLFMGYTLSGQKSRKAKTFDLSDVFPRRDVSHVASSRDLSHLALSALGRRQAVSSVRFLFLMPAPRALP